MAKPERHAWLRDALADKKLKAADLAQAWDTDAALVSRFIKTGNAKLNFERLQLLARLLGMDLNTLAVKLETRPIPKRALERPAKPAPAPAPQEPAPHDFDDDSFNALVRKLQKAAPAGFRVRVNLEYVGAALPAASEKSGSKPVKQPLHIDAPSVATKELEGAAND